MIYFTFVLYMKHRMQIKRTFGIRFDDKLGEVYATKDFAVARR